MTPISSVAVRAETGTVRLVAVAGRLNELTVGTVVSGMVTVTDALLPVDTLPAASLAQAKNVLFPSVAVTFAGAEAVHSAAEAAGALDVLVIM